MKKLIFFTLFLMGSSGILQAQSLSQFVVGNSGETISGASGTLSFTVGEPIIGTSTNGPSLGQGFWLGAIEGIILNAEDFSFESTTTVYPNPVRNQLTISFQEMVDDEFNVMVYDITGKKVLQENLPIHHSVSYLNFESLSNGTYLLEIIRVKDSYSKTFKIIKN